MEMDARIGFWEVAVQILSRRKTVYWAIEHYGTSVDLSNISRSLAKETDRVVGARVGVEDKSDDQAVQTQDLGENEDKDLGLVSSHESRLVGCGLWVVGLTTMVQTHHSDEKPGLLGGTPDTGVTDDTNGETSGETGETDGKTGTELDETSVEGHGRGHWTSQ